METSRVHLNVRLQQQTPTCQAAGAPGSEKPQPTPIPSRSVLGQRREAPARPDPARGRTTPRGPGRQPAGAAPEPLGEAWPPGSAAPWRTPLRDWPRSVALVPCPSLPAGDYPQRSLWFPQSQPRRGGWGRATSGHRASGSPSCLSCGRPRLGCGPASRSAVDERFAPLIPPQAPAKPGGLGPPRAGRGGGAGAALRRDSGG